MSEDAMQSAVAIIKAEHRSLAAVLKGMQYLLEQAQATGHGPNFGLLRAGAYYIEAYAETLHHPKEEAYLFRLLSRRTGEYDEEIARLEREHMDEAQDFYELARALKRYQARTEDGPAAFQAALSRMAEGAWRHMRCEEEVILPAAVRHLSPADWQEIAQAFSRNGDPRFGSEPDEHFRALFARLGSLIPAETVARF